MTPFPRLLVIAIQEAVPSFMEISFITMIKMKITLIVYRSTIGVWSINMVNKDHCLLGDDNDPFYTHPRVSTSK